MLTSDKDESGSALVATRAIEADSNSPVPLIVCPESLMIGPGYAEALFGSVWNENPHIRQPLVKLAFLYEVLTQENSKWAVYFQNLPTYDEIGIPTAWNSSELQWLKGSNIYSHVATRIQQWDQEWEDLNEYVEDFDWTSFTLEKYHWACAIFMSRSFPARVVYQDEKYGSEELNLSMLLPMVDSLNHTHQTAVFWDATKDSFTYSLGYAVSEGSEIFNNYGPKGNEELLMGYGFCTNNYAFDLVTVKLVLPPLDHIMETLLKLGIETENGTFSAHLSLSSPLNTKLLLLFTALSKASESIPSQSSAFTRSEKLKGISALQRALNQKLNSLEQEAVVLKEEELALLSSLSRRRYASVALYRNGQKMILEKSLKACDKLEGELIDEAKTKVSFADAVTPETKIALSKLFDIDKGESLFDDESNAEVVAMVLVTAEYLKNADTQRHRDLVTMWEVFGSEGQREKDGDSEVAEETQDIYDWLSTRLLQVPESCEIAQIMARGTWTAQALLEGRATVARHGYWLRGGSADPTLVLVV